jgi:NAD(P)-dependent dehydrogenase (short-subunit alcohol dehydrogenase family)
MGSSPNRFLAGRRAIVTGASRGIGAGIAERLAFEGADVAIVARTVDQHDHLPGSLNATLEKMRASGSQAVAVDADLADPQSRSTIVERAVQGLGGPIDILVNNAAAAIYAPLSTYPAKRRHITFQVNVEAPLDLAQAVLPGMLERGDGWILNVSSATARLPEKLADNESATIMAVYGASKAALNRLTVGLAAEVFGKGVRINTVEPRAAVLSEGAAALVGDRLDPSMIESMEQMVEAALYLCRCDPDVTGRVTVSLDVLEQTAIPVYGLDGRDLTPA